MYCSCLGDTLDQTSGNVDCSWKETQPVCPPANFGKESCKVRTKRSTDVDDDDNVVIDVSPDIVAYTERPEVVCTTNLLLHIMKICIEISMIHKLSMKTNKYQLVSLTSHILHRFNLLHFFTLV